MKNASSQKIPGAASAAQTPLRRSRGGGAARCGAEMTGTATGFYVPPPALKARQTLCHASLLAASSSSSG